MWVQMLKTVLSKSTTPSKFPYQTLIFGGTMGYQMVGWGKGRHEREREGGEDRGREDRTERKEGTEKMPFGEVPRGDVRFRRVWGDRIKEF